MKALRWFILAVVLALPMGVRAALPDEIQIYTDDINEPGEFGLEMHVNTTPRGVKTPDYPGEVTTDRGLRITPEFSWGLTRTLEAGLYLPLVIKSGNWGLAGYKARIKWLPIKGDQTTGGWYAGTNFELSNVQGKYNDARHNAELRIMLGYRASDWLIGVNPVYRWALSSAQSVPPPQNPQFSFNTKAMVKVAEKVSMGLEYYNEKGTWRNFDLGGEQGKTLYWVIEVENKVLPFHFGIGRGLNDATDRWTVKAIFDVPI